MEVTVKPISLCGLESHMKFRVSPTEPSKSMKGVMQKIMKTVLNIQHLGQEVTDKEIVAKIKELWVADGNKIKDIKTLDLYIKPEDMAVYYVINANVSGSVKFADCKAAVEE